MASPKSPAAFAIAALFGQRAKALRLEKGWTRRELALLVGVSGNYVWRLENGTREPAASVVVGMAKALGVPTDYLLGVTDSCPIALLA